MGFVVILLWPFFADANAMTLNESVNIALQSGQYSGQAGVMNREAIEQMVTVSYYDLSKTSEYIVIQKENVEELQKHYKSIVQLYDKGVFAKVELLTIQMLLTESKLKLLELEGDFRNQLLVFNKLLQLKPDEKMVVDPLPEIVHKYNSYAHWLAIEMHNCDLLDDDDVKKNMELVLQMLPESADRALQESYASISYKWTQLNMVDKVIKQARDILGLQRVRLKNSLVTSDVVIAALEQVQRAQQKRIDILFDYNVATVEARRVFRVMQQKSS